MCPPSPPSPCEAHTSPLPSFTAMFSCWRSRGTGKSKERKGINSVCNAFPTFLCVPQISTDSYVPLGVLAGGLTGEARGTPPLAFRGGFCLLPFAFVGAQVDHVRGKGDWSKQQLPKVTMKHYPYLENVGERALATTAAEVRGRQRGDRCTFWRACPFPPFFHLF